MGGAVASDTPQGSYIRFAQTLGYQSSPELQRQCLDRRRLFPVREGVARRLEDQVCIINVPS